MYSAKTFIQGAGLKSAAIVYYQAPLGTVARITQMSFTNTAASPIIINLYIVPSNSAPATTDLIIKDKTLQAGETWVPYQALGAVLPTGGTIQATASTNDVVILKSSGIELTA